MHTHPTLARADHLRTLVDALLDSAKCAEADKVDSAEIAAFLMRGLAQAAAADDTMKTAARLTGPTVAILKTSAVGMTESLHTSVRATLDNIRFPQLLPGEPVNPALEEIAAAAVRYTKRENTDFIGQMNQALAVAEAAAETCLAEGGVTRNGLAEYRDSMADLAALALAQVMLADQRRPAAATPTDAEIESLMADDEDAEPSPLQTVKVEMERTRRHRLPL